MSKSKSLANLRNFGLDSLDLLQSPFNVAKDVLNIPVAGFQDLSDLMKSDDENMLGRSRSRRGRGRKSKKSKAMKSKSMKSKSMKSKAMKSKSRKVNNPKKKASCKVRHMVWVKKSNKKRAHCRKHKSKM